MIYLYDTYDAKLKKITENFVKIYVCGLTPYDKAHLGHARTYVAFDVLKRFLLYKGKKVLHIQNITDIDDKILAKSKELNMDPLEVANIFNKEAMEAFDKLNILRADLYPKVSEHINDIIKAIEKLLEEGFAYETKNGVYFSVKKFSNYGKLSKQTLEELKKHRIEPDETKKDERDFALWKKTNDYGWESPFGKGRPGWHIECSVMALKYAKNLTIHGGGSDLIFPHHENEIAQSEAITKKRFAKIWLHTGYLNIKGVKMSKSLKNFITIEEALNKYSVNALRLFFISSSLNQPLDFNEEKMKSFENNAREIEESYKTLLTSIYEKPEKKEEKEIIVNERKILRKVVNLRKKFINALENNLNFPEALTAFYEFTKTVNENAKKISKNNAEILLLFFHEFSFITGFQMPLLKKTEEREKELLDIIIKTRNMLREKKLYEVSDEIRNMLNRIGIEIYDEGKETKIRYF